MSTPEHALEAVAEAVRRDSTLLSPELREADGDPALGALAAAGPRAQGAEADYAFVVEAIREGYLLHYGDARLFGGLDPDLALLAGDHLYALGLERLSGLGDLESVRELSDLISLSALVHADGPGDPAATGAIWLAATTAIAVGPSDDYAAAKQSLRDGSEDAAEALTTAAQAMAGEAGLASPLARSANSIDFSFPESGARG